jgi:hypothetical protein
LSLRDATLEQVEHGLRRSGPEVLLAHARRRERSSTARAISAPAATLAWW